MCGPDIIYCTLRDAGIPDLIIIPLYATVASSVIWGPIVFFALRWRKPKAPIAAPPITPIQVPAPVQASVIQVIHPTEEARRDRELLNHLIEEPDEPDDYKDVDDGLAYLDDLDPEERDLGNEADTPFPEDSEPEEPTTLHLDFDEWSEVVVGNRQEYAHALVNGPTGSGKTTLALALAHKYAEQGTQFYVITANHAKGQWGDKVVAIDDDGEYTSVELAFRALLDEIGRRAAILKNEGPDALTWLTIIWDELPETVEECKSGAVLLRKLARRGRAIKMGVLGLMQLDTAAETSLKGRTGLKKGFTHIYLASTARERLKFDFPRRSRPAGFVRGNTTIIADLDGVKELSEQALDPSMFVEFDLDAYRTEDTVEWSQKHVLAALHISGNKALSNYALTKILYPQSNGSGGYAQMTKKIVAEVRAALVANQKAAERAAMKETANGTGTDSEAKSEDDGTEDDSD